MRNLYARWVPRLLNTDKSESANDIRSTIWTDSTDFVRRWIRPLQARTQTAVEAVVESAKECEIDRICRKGHGQYILGCQRDPIN